MYRCERVVGAARGSVSRRLPDTGVRMVFVYSNVCALGQSESVMHATRDRVS